MIRTQLILAGLLCTLAVGCSKGDKKSAPGPAAVETAPVTELNKGENNNMTFTISDNGEVKVTLAGEVIASQKQKESLKSADGSLTADTLTISGKKYIFTILHDSENRSDSHLYLFELNSEDTYELRIDRVKIDGNTGLDQIYQAISLNVNDGLKVNEAINHMVTTLTNDANMTFAQYLKSLESATTPVVVEEPGEASTLPEPIQPAPIQRDEESEVIRPAPVQRQDDVVFPDGEPTPRELAPAIRSSVATSPRPPRNVPQRMQVTVGSETSSEFEMTDLLSTESGESVVLLCNHRDATFQTQKGLSQPVINKTFPLNVRKCADRTNEKSHSFYFNVILNHLNYIDTIDGLNYRVKIHTKRQPIVQKGEYELNSTFKYGRADQTRGALQILKATQNSTMFQQELTLHARKSDTSFKINLVCHAIQTNRRCAQR